MSRHFYQSHKMSVSVDVSQMTGCCGVGVIGFMSHVNYPNSDKERDEVFRNLFKEIVDEYTCYGCFILTDVKEDEFLNVGSAYASYDYKHDDNINLYNFAKANRFKLDREFINPNTSNTVCTFSKVVKREER